MRFAATARRVTAATAAALPGSTVRPAYLDLNEPLVGDVLAATDGDVTLVPLLFGDGYHSKIDLPAIVARAHAANPRLRARITPVAGSVSPVPALVDRLRQAGYRPGDGVLLYAVGSSDAGSDRAIRLRGRELAAALGGRPVETIFATRLGPDGAAVREAVGRLRIAAAGRIVGVPLFLSAGLLTERVEDALDRHAPGSLVAGPIGAHPALIGAISALARAGNRTLAVSA